MKTAAVQPDSGKADKPPKLTNWTKEPTLSELRDDHIAAGQHSTKWHSDLDRWDKLHKATLPSEMEKDKTRSRSQPKLVRRQAEWRYGSLSEPFLGTDKLFTISPVTGEDVAGARQHELLINHQFRNKIDRVFFIDQYVRAGVDEGTIVVRVGWKREVKKLKHKVPVYDYFEPTSQQEVELLDAALQEKQKDPTTFKLRAPNTLQASVAWFEEHGDKVIAIPTGEMTEVEEEQILANHPTVEVINPRNIRIDPSCGGNYENAKFITYTFETSESALKQDQKRLGYKNLSKVDWENLGVINTSEYTPDSRDNSFQFKDRSRKRVVATEYWGLFDIAGNGELVPIVATWVGDQLIRMQRNPYPDNAPPFVIVPYLPRKREAIGDADAELLEDQQQNIGALQRGMIDLMARSANSQTAIAQGALDTHNRRRFYNGQDFEINPNIPSQNAIHQLKYPEIPTSAINLMAMLNQDAESITGVKSFSAGVNGDSYGKVVAGIQGALDASAKREMAIMRRLVAGQVKICKKIIAMNQVFLSDVEIVRVTNRQAFMLERLDPKMSNDEFVDINREELQGFFDVIIDISTAEVDAAKAQELGFMLQTLGPKGDWKMVQTILAEIARLKRLPDLEAQIRAYEPQPDPLEEEKKKLEIAELQAKIVKVNAEAEEARAKARKAIAEAEQIDLDAVEQGNGVSHERDLQKQAAQAKSLQDLEVTKSLVKPIKEKEKPGDVAAGIGYNQFSDTRPSFIPKVDNTVPVEAQMPSEDTSYNEVPTQMTEPPMDPVYG